MVGVERSLWTVHPLSVRIDGDDDDDGCVVVCTDDLFFVWLYNIMIYILV